MVKKVKEAAISEMDVHTINRCYNMCLHMINLEKEKNTELVRIVYHEEVFWLERLFRKIKTLESKKPRLDSKQKKDIDLICDFLEHHLKRCEELDLKISFSFSSNSIRVLFRMIGGIKEAYAEEIGAIEEKERQERELYKKQEEEREAKKKAAAAARRAAKEVKKAAE